MVEGEDGGAGAGGAPAAGTPSNVTAVVAAIATATPATATTTAASATAPTAVAATRGGGGGSGKERAIDDEVPDGPLEEGSDEEDGEGKGMEIDDTDVITTGESDLDAGWGSYDNFGCNP